MPHSRKEKIRAKKMNDVNIFLNMWTLGMPMHILIEVSKCQVLVEYEAPTPFRFKNIASDILR